MSKLTKERKKEIVSQIKKWVSESPATTFVHFFGLNIQDEQKMRNDLREQGVAYTVARKSLMKRAFEEAGIKGQMPSLDGEVAISFLKEGDDVTAPARAVQKFVEQYGDSLSIIGGIFQGEYKDAQQMQEIATIPSEETLHGMFANVINSPIQGFVIALSQIAEKKES